MNNIGVTVNGQLRPVRAASAHTTALEWLRGIGLTGGKEGCAEGECGACAILVATPAESGGTSWTSVNACLVPVAALNGQELVTAEGLGTPERLHPVQREMAAAGGSQCGYCTPGFVCSMAAEFYRSDRVPDAEEQGRGTGHDELGPNGFDLHALSGNLCRCTGYRPIRDAAYALGEPAEDDALAARRTLAPPPPVAADVDGPDGRFVRPVTLADALRLLGADPAPVLIAGATDWGVEVNLRGRRAPLVVAVDQLAELRTLTVGDRMIEIGAAVPLSEAERILAGRVPLLAELFPQFGSRLIRNRASLGGNLGTGSPIGDAPPALLALGASVVLASADGDQIREREVDLADYFTGYRTTVLRPNELIRSIRIPVPLAPVAAFHKIAKRRFDDISSVAVAFALDIEPNGGDGGIVASARIGLGGVAATPLRAFATEAALVGKPWNSETVRAAAAVLGAEGTPMSDHRASADYRSLMLNRAILKLYSQTAHEARAVRP